MGTRTSLRTSDDDEARQIAEAWNQAEHPPVQSICMDMGWATVASGA